MRLFLWPAAAPRRRPPTRPAGAAGARRLTAFRGQNGAHYVYTCPFYGVAGSIWGTDVYTDDSSVCTAAVHAGLITLAGGGTVTIEIRPGSVVHGLDAEPDHELELPVLARELRPRRRDARRSRRRNRRLGLERDGGALSGRSSAPLRLHVPGRRTPGHVWGTDVYTDDSSVCTAAAHVGVITPGGRRQRHDRDARRAGVVHRLHRNGITSSSYAQWMRELRRARHAARRRGPAAAGNGDRDRHGERGALHGRHGRVQLSGRRHEGDAHDDDRGGRADRHRRRPAFRAAFQIVRSSDGRSDRRRAPPDRRAASHRAIGSLLRPATRRRSGSFGALPRGTSEPAAAMPRRPCAGTRWLTVDRCDGTLTQVREGRVAVRDFVKRKTVFVTAGKSYLAKKR